ncbi:unnamed protein product (macronuclear) [Paramecium tetraurelia]|uniref:Transmembrane protein n=1 Tax=Paramecium tetraurelia TaxID=5888 RepID=A0BNP8_PARTE|nr:uncharacterized protein GSPATT00030804001 [Paramecium tetraurelia]CAK60165.1 unnamed protein product [Paramecium tetraurelia]|eukprot:XP_001427563.1 hypothetical protein (macronuclear) [Paramecium tetraurelia strain d4-2]
MSEQITSSQVIEFFWFFFPFLLFVSAVLLKFYIKTSIHLDQSENRAKSYSQQSLQDRKSNEPKRLDHDGIQGPEVQIVGNDMHHQQMNMVDEGEKKQIQQSQQQFQQIPQLSTISPNLTQNTRTAKVFDGLNELVSTYFPLLSVSIICINNFAAWSWALACVILFLIFVIAFNILQVQRNFSDTIKKFLFVSHHVWLSGLFISYLACKLKLSD